MFLQLLLLTSLFPLCYSAELKSVQHAKIKSWDGKYVLVETENNKIIKLSLSLFDKMKKVQNLPIVLNIKDKEITSVDKYQEVMNKNDDLSIKK